MSKTEDDAKLGCGLIVLLILLSPCILGGCYIGSSVTYSTGYRDGVVQKVSEKGLIFKTTEGVADLGGFQLKKDDEGNGNHMIARLWEFSVTSDTVKSDLAALPPNARVRLHYEQRVSRWTPKGSTSYIVTSVERMDK